MLSLTAPVRARRAETLSDELRRRARRLLVAAVASLGAALTGPAAAQAATSNGPGQFTVGDVVVLDVTGVPAMSDTFQVHDGLVLQLPNIPPLSLAGVRRADVQAHLTQELGRYLVNPTVRAYALVRMGVMGAVETPGFYVVRSDAPLSDLLMQAGGLTHEANPDKISIRRDGETVIKDDLLRTAMAKGATLETLELHTGDQLTVGERRRVSWMDVLRNGAYLAGIAVSLYAGRALF